MLKENTTPEISVIMGIYNQRYHGAIDRAVDSILAQSFSDFEFIIYDDGSDADISEKIRSLKKRDDRIVVIGSDENQGLAFSLNQCLGRARGRYIARMDADDISCPDRLMRERSFLEEHPLYDWCGCNARIYDEKGEWGHTVRPEIPAGNDYLKYSPYIHPSVMYRAQILQDIGGYDDGRETLRCEDYEIFLRLYQSGYRGYNIQEELLLYYIDRDGYHERDFKYRIYEAKVRYRNFRKMGILFPRGWLYCLRPIIGAFIPVGLIEKIKGGRSSL